MDLLNLLEEPKGEAYRKLIEYAFETSDAFMVIFYDEKRWASADERKVTKAIREVLSPYLIKTRSDGERWPGTTGNFVDSFEGNYIDLYRCSKELLPFALSPNRLFGWYPPKHPMDPSFFRNGECWFESITHEGLALIATTLETDHGILDSCGIPYGRQEDWRGTLFIEEYRI